MKWWQQLWGSAVRGAEQRPYPPPPSPRDQIEALLTNRAYDLTSRHLGIESTSASDYRAVFTLKREQIAEYIKENGIVLEDYSAKYHWLWLIRADEKWVVQQFLPPEKGPGEYIDYPFETEKEARAELLKRVLRNTQTAVYL